VTAGIPGQRAWSDEQLSAAVASSHSWRGVMRALGLGETSAGSIRVIRRHVERLGLDASHFTGQRRWSDAQLRRAYADAACWTDLTCALGLSGSSGDHTRIKAHLVRLGLDLRRLQAPAPVDGPAGAAMHPARGRLREAGGAIAAAWFLLCGCNVSLPIEPALFDLLAAMPGGVKRIQVKTTTCITKDGWMVSVGRRPYSPGNRARLVPYDPDDIDYFFIADGELRLYLIPSRALAGRVQVLLRNYAQFTVGSLRSLWPDAASAG
jgi:hypothetical protein